MPDTKRQFSVTHEADQYVFGHFEDIARSGVYLPAEYLFTLANVLTAAKIRLGSLQGAPVPDAIKSLVTMLEELIAAHQIPLAQEKIDYETAIREMKEAIEKLQGGNDDGPRRA